IAIKIDGTLWAWGSNDYGGLGLGDKTLRWTPTQVGSETTWSLASAGAVYTIAIKTDGTLWAWGHNSDGQLGLGDNTEKWTPMQVGTATNWTAGSSGTSRHSLAIKTDGTLWSWGWNYYGQLGLGDTTARNSPIQIPYHIKGYVRNSSGAGINAVTINLTGESANSYNTDSTGYYAFVGILTGNYMVTPSKTDYIFNPVSRSTSPLSADIDNWDFTGNCPPSIPVNTSPLDGALLSKETRNPTFIWSSFYDAEGDLQSALQVQLRDSTGNYGDITSQDSGEVLSSTNTYTPGDWDLSSGNTYYWRVKVKDDSNFENAWSTWSAETVFYIQDNIQPSSPANISPSIGAELSRVVMNPTFGWSAFYDIDGDTQSAVLVQLRYSTGTYGDVTSKDSGEVLSSTNTHTPIDWNLSLGNTYYWRVKVKDNSNCENAWSTWSAETVFYIQYNIPPSLPTNISPSSGAELSRVVMNPTFGWSAFYDIDGDTQSAVLVQLRYSTETYGDVASKDSGEVLSSTNIWTPTDWDLSPGNTCYWRVKVKDNSNFDNAWSTWSAETAFYIANNIKPEQPSNSSPAGSAYLTDSNPLFIWSSFYDADGDTQSAAQVQLRYSTGTYSDAASKDSGEVLSSTNTYTPGDWDLSSGNTYYWRVKVKDSSGFDNCWSEWSEETFFVKIPEAPAGITINLPAGETQIKDNDTITISGTAEPGMICEIFVKDQSGRTVTGIKLNVGDDGQISAPISVGEITKNYPLATSVQVEVFLRDPLGNISSTASSSFVVFKAETAEVKLYDNLINPAEGKPVTIRYELPSASGVTIEVYSRSGSLIKKIVDNQSMAAGVYSAEWLGKNTDGNVVASGIYVIHIKTDFYSKILKAVVVK
ncbi:MAG: FlgD immunoglobulin-like domain containing protein, partial [Elusimicrobiota bacterium]|nr:FlgD immunoglobulin-like domain containing protein [Elusimicrobiota bacterium]